MKCKTQLQLGGVACENFQLREFLRRIEISLRELRDGPIVIAAVNTGMRKGEILNLKWRDIGFSRGVIHIYQSKNGEIRDIPVNK